MSSTALYIATLKLRISMMWNEVMAISPKFGSKVGRPTAHSMFRPMPSITVHFADCYSLALT